jgi:hypothetical protein
MCDYSLESVASRPAKVGDRLVTTSFHNSITRGFAATEDRNIAVCVLPGTEIAFERTVLCDPALSVFGSQDLGQSVARFRQVNPGQEHTHHDALEFPDGQIVLLTRLREGQHATVLQLPASPQDHGHEHAHAPEAQAASTSETVR